MNQHEAPFGTVATLGHPANKCLIVKVENGSWMYLNSHKLAQFVNDEAFRAGWDVYRPEGAVVDPPPLPMRERVRLECLDRARKENPDVHETQVILIAARYAEFVLGE